MARFLVCLYYRLLTQGQIWVDRSTEEFDRRSQQRELFKAILGEQNLRFDRDDRPPTAYSLGHTCICLSLMEGADIYQIAKNSRDERWVACTTYPDHILSTLWINSKPQRDQLVRWYHWSLGS